jgi:GDP-L-fucose synthase
MRVLLTGGTGFIGRNLAPLLAQRHELLAPTRQEMDLLDDTSVRRWLAAHPVDAIVHSATHPAHRNAKDPSSAAYKNLRMFFHLTDAPVSRFIVLGSGSEYDLRHYTPKMPEERLGQHVPADENGLSKYVISRYAEKDPRFVVLRLFGVFGKHEDYAIRFISNAICKALFGLPITIKQNRRFDYLDVEDLAPVVEHFLSAQPAHAAYNVTPDEAVELLALGRMVLEAHGRPLPVQIAQEGLGLEYSGDNRRLRAEMPGLRLTPIKEAVGRLYSWYAENKASIREEALRVDK